MMGYTVSAVQISANRRTAFLLAQALIHGSAQKDNSVKFPLRVCSEVSDSATRCLAGQLDAAVGSHREGRVPRHFPQDALGISEETVAPEEDLLCLLDYRGSRLGSFCEYFIHLPLLSHVVRQRDAREPAVLHMF